MEETVKDRLMLFIKEKGLSQKRFEETAHISNGYANNLKASPSSKVLQKIFCAFPDLSQSWLLTGEGPMLNDKKPAEQSAGLPLIPVNFMAGALSGVDGRWMDYECDHFTVPGFESADFLITVMGDSMQPTLVSGDVLAVKRVEASKLWFQWGKIYVLATRQGCIVKRILPSDKEGCVSIVSDNKSQYPAYDLDGGEINSIGLAIGLVRQF